MLLSFFCWDNVFLSPAILAALRAHDCRQGELAAARQYLKLAAFALGPVQETAAAAAVALSSLAGARPPQRLPQLS